MVLVTGLMEEGLIKRLVASVKCESCGRHYEMCHINVLGHCEDLWFLKLFCSTCQTQCLVAAVIKESKVPEIFGEIAEPGMDKFQGDVIEIDDLLNMHNFLKDFDGNFSWLFSQEKS